MLPAIPSLKQNEIGHIKIKPRGIICGLKSHHRCTRHKCGTDPHDLCSTVVRSYGRLMAYASLACDNVGVFTCDCTLNGRLALRCLLTHSALFHLRFSLI